MIWMAGNLGGLVVAVIVRASSTGRWRPFSPWPRSPWSPRRSPRGSPPFALLKSATSTIFRKRVYRHRPMTPHWKDSVARHEQPSLRHSLFDVATSVLPYLVLS